MYEIRSRFYGMRIFKTRWISGKILRISRILWRHVDNSNSRSLTQSNSALKTRTYLDQYSNVLRYSRRQLWHQSMIYANFQVELLLTIDEISYTFPKCNLNHCWLVPCGICLCPEHDRNRWGKHKSETSCTRANLSTFNLIQPVIASNRSKKSQSK